MSQSSNLLFGLAKIIIVKSAKKLKTHNKNCFELSSDYQKFDCVGKTSILEIRKVGYLRTKQAKQIIFFQNLICVSRVKHKQKFAFWSAE